MNIYSWLLKKFGWYIEISVNLDDYPKCIVCVAPHTSNWDFILGELAIRALGVKAHFLMKEAWFRWPLGYFFRAIGGIPVPKKRGAALTEAIVKKFNESDRLMLAITPEGTRKATTKWRSGFLHIAREANVPILLAGIDYKFDAIDICREFKPSGDIKADMRAIKDYYKIYYGRFPDQFLTADEQESESSGNPA
ncbi:MAG: 1-acyl-sn-glycerol-3-phosphate acyltransferase [Muribaculum sp.]|nr:1-acyl-sn-glycerol-3-phosphate acyltransferase [Muribaculum sp.]